MAAIPLSTVKEVCVCGAAFEAHATPAGTADAPEEPFKALLDWRTRHDAVCPQRTGG